MSNHRLAPSAQERWTRIEQYLGALARRRTARRSRRPGPGPRTQPESPRLMLSTVPFAALILVLALLVVAFAIAAWPRSQPAHQAPPAPRDVGNAPPGWFDEAKKEMR